MTESTDTAAAPPSGTAWTRLAHAGGCVLLAMLVLAGVWKEKFLILLVAGTIALLLLPAASWAGLAFFSCALGFRQAMDFMPLHAGGFKVYLGDFLLFLLGAMALQTAVSVLRRGTAPIFELSRRERLLAALLVAGTCWGVFSAINGVRHGLLPRDVVGDFRRLYFYAWVFFVPLGFRYGRVHLRLIPPALLAGCGMALLFGLYRLATGNWFYPNDEINIFPRLLVDDEVVSLALLLAYCTALLTADRSRALKLAVVPLAGLTAAMMCFSGWRMGIAEALLAPLLVVVIMARNRGRGLFGIGVRVAVVLAVLAAGVGAAFFLFSGKADRVVFMLKERIANFGTPMFSVRTSNPRDRIEVLMGGSAASLREDPLLVGNGLEIPGSDRFADHGADADQESDVPAGEGRIVGDLEFQHGSRRRIERGNSLIRIEYDETVLDARKNGLAFVFFRHDLFDLHFMVAVELRRHLIEFGCQYSQFVFGLDGDLHGIIPRGNPSRRLDVTLERMN